MCQKRFGTQEESIEKKNEMNLLYNIGQVWMMAISIQWRNREQFG